MVQRKHFTFILIFTAAVVLTFLKIPVASSQGLTLVPGQVEGELPQSDPNSELWREATSVEVPLSAQNVSKPFLLETRIKSVTARALQNDSQIAVLVEWTDETQDNNLVSIQDFRDAVALQFPLAAGQPFFCMGQQGSNVNIWHWKADWQADLLARQDMETRYPDMYIDYYPYAPSAEGVIASVADYTDPNYLPALETGNLFAAIEHKTPVEDLVAGGFGSLTAQPVEAQNVQGYGVWANGKWQVIFSRDLASPETDDISFSPGKTYSLAFAVWDGSNEERNGQKSTSQWISFHVTTSAPVAPTTEETSKAGTSWLRQNIRLIIVGIFALLVIAGALIYIRLPN
jgi:hypothetical protein